MIPLQSYNIPDFAKSPRGAVHLDLVSKTTLLVPLLVFHFLEFL